MKEMWNLLFLFEIYYTKQNILIKNALQILDVPNFLIFFYYYYYHYYFFEYLYILNEWDRTKLNFNMMLSKGFDEYLLAILDFKNGCNYQYIVKLLDENVTGNVLFCQQ